MGVTLPTALETLKALERRRQDPKLIELTKYCKNRDVPDIKHYDGDCRGCRVFQYFTENPVIGAQMREAVKKLGKTPWSCYNGANHPDIIVCEAVDRTARGETTTPTADIKEIYRIHGFLHGGESSEWERMRIAERFLSPLTPQAAEGGSEER